MLSLDLGPVALPVAPLLWLAALWLAGWLSGFLAPVEHKPAAGTAVWRAGLAGFLVARIAFLVGAMDLYAESPWSVFDIRDGGFDPQAGVLAAAAVAAWHGWRVKALRRPLGIGMGVAGVAWVAASTLIGVHDKPGAPALQLQDLAAAPVDLAELVRGQPTVVNLWATWCPPCRREMPVLAAAQQAETGVRFVFVNQRESAAVVAAYLAAKGLGLRHVLLDRDGQVATAVGSPGLPTTLFYDASGQLVDRHMGELSRVALESRLRLLRGAPKLPPVK
jgi:thiol-disulfide isomerase/thioredoxin